MTEPRTGTISRVAAFAAQGVSLKDPFASWSGLRADDGMVVFALRAEDVVVDGHGSRCLLWAPDPRRLDSPARAERLQHCILAQRHGQADGLLAFHEGREIDAALVLALRVERYRGEYWAKWGSALRALSVPVLESIGWHAVQERALAAVAG